MFGELHSDALDAATPITNNLGGLWSFLSVAKMKNKQTASIYLICTLNSYMLKNDSLKSLGII